MLQQYYQDCPRITANALPELDNTSKSLEVYHHPPPNHDLETMNDYAEAVLQSYSLISSWDEL